MTFNSFYNGITQNLFYGGIAATILIFILFRKANQIAATGSKGKMASWSFAPALMVIAAVVAHGAAVNIIMPRIQSAFASAPVQNTVALGSQLTATADSIIFGGGGGEIMAGYAGPEAFKAPVMEASYPSTQQAPVMEASATNLEWVPDVQVAPDTTKFQPLLGEPQVVPAPTLAPLQKVNMVGTTLTVLPGDSLAAIAKRAYGTTDGWGDIYEANKGTIGSNPNAIKAGMQLTIPAKGSQSVNTVANVAAPSVPAVAPEGIASDGRVYFNVSIPTPVPARYSTEAYQGHSQRVPVTVQQATVPIVVQPTPTRIAVVPTQPAVVVVAVKPGLDLARPSVDTSVVDLGASSSSSGTTMTIGN